MLMGLEMMALYWNGMSHFPCELRTKFPVCGKCHHKGGSPPSVLQVWGMNYGVSVLKVPYPL